MKKIQLSQGLFAIVDDVDFEPLNKYKWYAKKCGNTYYAHRAIRVCGVQKIIKMHKQIMDNLSSELFTDHKDGNGLNNTRKNLRVCSHAENMRNVRKQKNKSSPYKGVTFQSRDKVFHAKIRCDKKTYYLGTFKDEMDAAKAYDEKAKQLFGEFAWLNFNSKQIN